MHIYFSGIGGSGMSSLAMIAKQAGYEVSGSDIADSSTVDYLKKHGIGDIHIGQSTEQIAKVHKAKPIDWFVYSSALPLTDPDHAELAFCRDHNIKTGKRDDFLNKLIKDKGLKLIAVAGTHGKSTTTAMAIWLCKQLGLPISYAIGAKINFGEAGEYDSKSQHFIYEADEFDRNFLSFYPDISLISGLDWDHPDIYPTAESYDDAFREFVGQSAKNAIWQDDADRLGLEASGDLIILDQLDPAIDTTFKLSGHVNRKNAWLVAKALSDYLGTDVDKCVEILNKFPGLARRFEQITSNIYSDYAHTPPKIRGALQMAREVCGNNVVVVYEGLHNLRQHFIKDELGSLFDDVKKLYVVPSYLARENKEQELLTPGKLLGLLSNSAKEHAEAAELNGSLAAKIKHHAENGELVLCLSAGGAGSLDEWLRKKFS